LVGWRTTAVLVPLATEITVGRLAMLSPPARFAIPVCGASLAALVLCGVVIMTRGLAYRQSPEELPLLDWVREHQQRGDVYLLPVEIPKPRAAGSTSFTPPPRRDEQQGLISVDLQRFRLYTGAPIFIDFKSIPYKDAEVLEWWFRVRVAKALYERLDWSDKAVRTALIRFQITHAVAPANKPLHGAGEVVFQDENYILYRVNPAP